MSLSRRDFLKFSGATAAGVAAGTGIDLAPVEAAATSLKIKEAKAFAGVCPYCAVGCGQLIYTRDNKIIDIEGKDRKSTRLNSSHVERSYAVFCLKKK